VLLPDHDLIGSFGENPSGYIPQPVFDSRSLSFEGIDTALEDFRTYPEDKRILRKYGYPPDRQEKASQTILQQAKLLCGDWAESSQV
jgi:hypothetical protein